MYKKILIIIAILTLGSTFTCATTVSASNGLTQAQTKKLGYMGNAKTTKKITVHNIVHTYYAGRKTRTLKKGAHIHVSGGVGKWNWIITYKGKRYFYQHSNKNMKSITMINWFKEI